MSTFNDDLYIRERVDTNVNKNNSNSETYLKDRETNNTAIGFLNVCGIKNRIQYPDFCETVCKYDIFFVSETHLDCFDIINLNGYDFISKPRTQKYFRKSGGLGAFVKHEFKNYIETIDSESEYVMWLKLQKQATGHSADIIFGVTYIPPAQSRFYNDDDFDRFEQEITSIRSQYDFVYLVGDMNAQTAKMQDYTETDPFLSNLFDFDQETETFFDQKSNLERNGIMLDRASQDLKKNSHGYKLVDICKNNNLIIINGRFGDDKNIGAMTFRNISVIDYVISSIEGFSLLQSFSITVLDELHCDGHALLTFDLGLGKPLSDAEDIPSQPNRFEWQADKAEIFKQNINNKMIGNIYTTLNNTASENIDQAFMDSVVNKLNFVFLESAGKSLCQKSYKPSKNSTQSKNKKPWYGTDCKKAKRRYTKARKRYYRCPSEENKSAMKNACKSYRKTMKNYINKYHKEKTEKLRNLSKHNPKEYWKYLNRLRKNTNTTVQPDLNSMFDFFKNVNSAVPNDDSTDESLHLPDINDPNCSLNTPISLAEIEAAIVKLQNLKSPAGDFIINEYIKTSKDLMLPIYHALFNHILNTGIIPNQWLEGIILPIYKNKGDPLDPNNYRPITLLSCLGKLFTSVLNSRLTRFLDDNDRLCENQAGFRKQYSTIDHIFTLNSIVELLRSNKKKIFTTFVDFSKAFDSVWRTGLLSKLIKNGITGSFFTVIKNMYQNIKSCVSINGELSAFFSCDRGVRQGENLSPALFSIYLNELLG